jgi:hypothetical protein
VITVAHNCSLYDVAYDSARLFGEPWGDYGVALSMTAEKVMLSKQEAQERAERALK